MDPTQVRAFLKMIFLRCMRMLGDQEQAWDAAQEVMARYYEAARRRTIEAPLSYLCRASTNHCLDILRVSGRTVSFSIWDTLETERSVGVASVEGGVMVQQLFEHFAREDVRLLLHRHVEQMTYEEIGQLVGMSDRGVQKKLLRLEQKARALVQHVEG